MSQALSAPPVRLPQLDFKQWKQQTDVLGARRSTELQKLDKTIEEYCKQTNDVARLEHFKQIKFAFTMWKLAQQKADKANDPLAYRKSSRNKRGAILHLEAELFGTGDTDTDFGQVPPYMMEHVTNARLGVLYLFSSMRANPKVFSLMLEGGLAMGGAMASYAGAEVKDGGMGVKWAGNLSTSQAPVMLPVNIMLQDGIAARAEVHRNTLGSLWDKLKAWFQELGAALLKRLREQWKVELPAQIVSTAVGTVLSAVGQSLAGSAFGGAVDTVKGIIVTVDSIVTKYDEWRASKGVVLARGHPQAAVQAIRNGMTMSIGEGLYRTLKGAANIAIATATAGAGVIANVCIAGAEFLAKLFYRLYECLHMNRFFQECNRWWKARDLETALHKRPFAFNAWYQDWVLRTPALAALTLNSGICGDKMIWLSMFTDEKRQIPIGQQAFDKGVSYIDGLKPWAANYLRSAGFTFHANDPLVKKLILFAQGNVAFSRDAKAFVAADPTGTGRKILQFATRFAS